MTQAKIITKKKTAKFKYFCDCSICMAMKKADEEERSLDYEELKEAFENARKMKDKTTIPI